MTELVSVTTLIKDALGTSPGIAYSSKEKIAGIAFDKEKILRQFVEEGDRDAAVKWLLGQEWEGLQSAANRGTDIHRIAEAFHLGIAPPEYEPFLDPFVQQYRRYLADFRPEILMAEAPVYNFTLRYAGTLDGIAVIEGRSVLFDIKTTKWGPNDTDSKGKPRRRPPFAEVPLQLTLYRRAEKVGLLAERKEIQYRRYYVVDEHAHLEPMPEVEGAVCIVISPEDYMVVPVKTSEEIWTAARHVIQVAKYQTETVKTVFGPNVVPAVAA